MTNLELAILGKAMIDPENQPPQLSIAEAMNMFDTETKKWAGKMMEKDELCDICAQPIKHKIVFNIYTTPGAPLREGKACKNCHSELQAFLGQKQAKRWPICLACGKPYYFKKIEGGEIRSCCVNPKSSETE